MARRSADARGSGRDVSACLAQNYPLFSRGRFMRTGKDRVRLAAIGKPVTVSGIEIQPGTLVCADADGVVAVPAAEAGRIAETAGCIDRIEAGIVARFYERLGDHAVNIARRVVYLAGSARARPLTTVSRLVR